VKAYKTPYGHFSPDGSEYIVTTPRTPRPWINVISNGDYGLTVSQTGGGYSWRTHAQLNRITRWEQDLIRDDWGKYVYLRDEKNHLWSAGWKPVCARPKKYLCRHGIGYTVIESTNHDIGTELLVFVPEGEPLELWKLTVRNLSGRSRTIDVITYMEWCLGQSPDWHREFHKSFIETEYLPHARAIFAEKRLWEVPTDRGHWNTDWPYIAFHSSSMKPVSYDTDKETFLGMYGSPSAPAALGRETLGKRSGSWLDPVASLHIRLKMKPGQSKRVCFTLGAADSQKQAAELALKYRAAGEADRAFNIVKRGWEKLLSTVSVETPDDAMNIMQNKWLKYQAISGRLRGRTAYYQTGGAYGFRDQLQDSQIWLPISPEETKRQILLHAAHQFKDGTVYHWWHPITEIGMHNRISDNLLWLPYVMNSYLLETDDFRILSLAAPFIDQEAPATLYDHCCRAIDKALESFSERGLPLIGAGDWNDGLSAVGLDMKGESIWLGHFIHRILLDFGVIARRHGDAARSDTCVARARELASNLNSIGWDGGWYYGATKDSGEKIGSSENHEGAIWLNPQTWAIIAGVADEQRANHVMDAVEKRLETEIGPLLLRPAYSHPDKYIGYLTRYSPGMRENGGVYTHAAAWAVMAAAQLGRGESAFRIYSRLNPIYRGKEPDRYCAEPYVTPGNIEGPDSAFFGRGGWTWYTGSAAWLFRVGLEWILGVRPAFNGLHVDPCIPKSWKAFRLRRAFRGAIYDIHVENPEGVECGVKHLRVDGHPHCESKGPREKTLPVAPSGSTVSVRVLMGK
jgi:cellobiose phosphorylase